MTRKQALAKAVKCLANAETSIGHVNGKAYESWSLLSDRYIMLANELERAENTHSVGGRV